MIAVFLLTGFLIALPVNFKYNLGLEENLIYSLSLSTRQLETHPGNL